MDKSVSSITPDISVIIPVFNVEKYLIRCLDSVFKQKFTGLIEVIAVDDASTDNSLSLLYEYKKIENRLQVLTHEVNKKLSVARLTGMNKATGKFVMHVDSDDWLPDNSLESLYQKCRTADADVVVYNYCKEDSFGKKIFVNTIKYELATNNKQKVHPYFLGAPWNKIVKRSLLNNMVSGRTGINNGEDLVYATEILLRSEKIYLVPQRYYIYYVNKQSLTWAASTEQFLNNLIVVLKQLEVLMLEYHPTQAFQSFLMNYFEKWLYLEIAKINFLNKKEDSNKSLDLINNIFQFSLMSPNRVYRLKLALNNKLISIYEVFRRFGIRTAASILLKKLSNL
jgi:glycosyltransferase involved in cell wall biosynthesis